MHDHLNSEPSYHALQCLEVWGGNKAVHTSVTLPGIDAWVQSTPHGGNPDGGDVHYVSMCGAGRISRFAVADISGHGNAAGALGGRLRKLMRKHIRTPDQTVFARAINSEFSKMAQGGQFATALLTTYFAPTDHLIVCSLGHPWPLWYHAASSTWALLDQELGERVTDVRNLPLGIIAETEYVQFAVSLGEHDFVVLYTDSLTDARKPNGTMLGVNGLLALVQHLPLSSPAEMGHNILAAVAQYRSGGPSDDDETILVLHHNAANPPKQSISEKLKVMARMLGLSLGGD